MSVRDEQDKPKCTIKVGDRTILMNQTSKNQDEADKLDKPKCTLQA